MSYYGKYGFFSSSGTYKNKAAEDLKNKKIVENMYDLDDDSDPTFYGQIISALNSFFYPIAQNYVSLFEEPGNQETTNLPSSPSPANTSHKFRHIGTLRRDEDGKTLKLFARPEYIGANRFDYYVTTEESGMKINVPLDHIRNEILDEDLIDIDYFDSSIGKFKFYENNENNTSIFAVPSRGEPGIYKKLGLLRRSSDNKTVKLFGRQKYPGSSKYDYYVRSVEDGNMNIRIPLDDDFNDELFDGDEINIPFFDEDGSEGKFKFLETGEIYDAPRYNPWVY